jgi:hypothetical protein
MPAGITERDKQSAKTQAWHGMTNIVDVVTRENSMPYEIIEAPIAYKTQQLDELGFVKDVYIESPTFKQLIASDDLLPIGDPYSDSYHPGTIEGFWKIIEMGMGDTPYEIISAGTVDDRCKLFASLKVSDGFQVGDRKFNDFITLIDSFDKSTSLQARYSNVCVVCANTFSAVMRAGETIGKAKHTAMIDLNVQRLVNAIDAFVGTSSTFEQMLRRAYETPCSRDEARAWLTGIEGRNTETLSNGSRQKVARMAELFDGGRGNEGRTRLDAFSALTDFHSNESTNRKVAGAQNYTSNWGSSAQVKTLAVTRFEEDWQKNVSRGEKLLSDEKVALTA